MTTTIYKINQNFSDEEGFRLINQLCKFAVSMPANIVKGNSWVQAGEYFYFLDAARASLGETKYCLLPAKDWGYLKEKEISKVMQAMF